MTAQNRTTLKAFFETGDVPTQAQFGNLIDSSLNLVEVSAQTIVSDVSALGKFEVSGAFTVKSSSQANFTGNVITSGSFTVAASAQSNLSGNVFVSGAVVMANASGGSQGIGTINAAGLYINGASVITGTNLKTVAVRAFSVVGSSNYVPTAGTVFITGYVQAGGGGGGGTLGDTGEAGAAGGGGAGTTCQFFATAAQIGASQAVVIGAGGAGGAAGQNDGVAGSVSSFGAYVSCPGGLGGNASTSETTPFFLPGGSNTAQATVATVTSLLNRAGMGGGYGLIVNGTTAISGRGGDSLFGSGGPANNILAPNTDGNPGGTGAGGSGGYTINNNTDRAGGAGGNGTVVITEYSTQ